MTFWFIYKTIIWLSWYSIYLKVFARYRRYWDDKVQLYDYEIYLNLDSKVVCAICFVDNEVYSRLKHEEYLLDITAELVRKKLSYDLIFQRTVWYFPYKSTDNSMYIELMFHQVSLVPTGNFESLLRYMSYIALIYPVWVSGFQSYKMSQNTFLFSFEPEDFQACLNFIGCQCPTDGKWFFPGISRYLTQH